MSSYRFCRTDDVALLVEAWNRCGVPGGGPPLTVAAFKADIRERDVWCSSCMVAFESKDPVAVLIACKRPPRTMILRLAVHPAHRRRGHGRHLLESLSAKLAILGPERLLAEIPENEPAARALFSGCGFEDTGTLADFAWSGPGAVAPVTRAIERVTLEELPDGALPASDAPRSWDRSRGTLHKRKQRLEGLAAAGDRLDASLLYTREPEGLTVWSTFHAGDPEGEAALAALVRKLAEESAAILMPRVGEEELGSGVLAGLGFSPTGARYRAVSSLPSAR